MIETSRPNCTTTRICTSDNELELGNPWGRLSEARRVDLDKLTRFATECGVSDLHIQFSFSASTKTPAWA